MLKSKQEDSNKPKYTVQEFNNEFRIPLTEHQLTESYDLLKTTVNPDTYISRLEFFEKRLLEYDEMRQTNLFNSFQTYKEQISADFIDRYYEDTRKKITSMKQFKAKKKRADKFITDVLNRARLSEDNFIKISWYHKTLLDLIEDKEKQKSAERNEFYIRRSKEFNFEINDDEKLFIDELKRLAKSNFKHIEFERRGNGMLHVEYKGMQIGRIRLQKNKHWMQILSDDNVEYVNGEVNDFIKLLPMWLKYLESLKKSDF